MEEKISMKENYMINIIKYCRQIFFNERLGFKMKLINSITISGFIVATINSIIALSSYNSKILIYINVFLVIFTLGIFIYTNLTKKYALAALLVCIMLNIICLPILFVTSSGIISSIPIYFIFGIIISFTVLEGRSLSIMVPLEMVICIVTYLLRLYLDRGLDNWYEMQLQAHNSLVAVIIVSLSIGILFYTQKQIFISQQSENELQRLMLQESVKNIKAAKQEAELAKQEAETANRAKTEFLANMSHEIRTPMNVILGMTDLILQEEISGEVESKVVSIQRATRTLLALVNEILDLSKIESGKMEVVNNAYCPSGIFSELLEMTHLKLNGRPIHLVYSLPDDLPGQLYGDEVKFKQIMMNILGNAMKYTEEGEINVRVDWEKEDDMAILCIRVKDTGRGIRT